MGRAPHYDAHGVTLFAGDCLHVLPSLPDASVDAVVTDPPYELGFMGRAWDASGIAYRVDLWEECLRVLKPGGHLLAFGGTRTYHRLACAVEDAGFEIRDRIRVESYEMTPEVAWLYGSGFPKSKNLDGDWQGWGTALKPSHEPIVVARKVLAGNTVAANVERHGTGALNIDACRVAMGDTSMGGRWPSNVVLLHHPGCGADCAPSCRVTELDRQSGYRRPGERPASTEHGPDRTDGWGMRRAPGQREVLDGGGASRFFPTFRYEAKADGTERPRAGHVTHPTVKPLALMAWLIRLVTPPGGVVLDPFAGSGTTAEACIVEGFRCITIEREPSYLPLIVDRITKRTDPVAHFAAQAERGEDAELGLFALLDEDGAA